MEYAEIVELLAEMLLEDVKQPAISEAESPGLLEECLRAYEYECRWKSNSASESPQEPNQAQTGEQSGQTHAASLPADDSVNRPALPLGLAVAGIMVTEMMGIAAAWWWPVDWC